MATIYDALVDPTRRQILNLLRERPRMVAELTASERIVSTFEFEGLPGNVLLEAIIFEALPDGRTRITGTGTSIFTSDEARDQMMNTGMEEGAKETWDRFAELLPTLQTA